VRAGVLEEEGFGVFGKEAVGVIPSAARDLLFVRIRVGRLGEAIRY
jgi:hypothetical protein